MQPQVIKDGRDDGALTVDDGADAEKICHKQVSAGYLFEGTGNHWGVVTTSNNRAGLFGNLWV